MKNKQFYNIIFSKTLPLGLLIMSFAGGFYGKYVRKVDTSVLVKYIFFSICLIIIIEIFVSFLRTLKIISKKRNEYKNKLKLYLIYIPYGPPIIALFLLFLVLRKINCCNYKYILFVTYGLVASINLVFSMILNIKVKILSLIED